VCRGGGGDAAPGACGLRRPDGVALLPPPPLAVRDLRLPLLQQPPPPLGHRRRPEGGSRTGATPPPPTGWLWTSETVGESVGGGVAVKDVKAGFEDQTVRLILLYLQGTKVGRGCPVSSKRKGAAGAGAARLLRVCEQKPERTHGRLP